MKGITFRNISDAEKEHAYSIICRRTDWLNKRNIKQWTEPLPYDEFEKRQAKGENFGLFEGNTLTVFLSLVKTCHPYWRQETCQKQTWWLETLASGIEFSGKELGTIAVGRAVDYLKTPGEQGLYLDCVKGAGFLPDYYGRLGFHVVAEKNIDFPKCGLTHMILMKHDL